MVKRFSHVEWEGSSVSVDSGDGMQEMGDGEWVRYEDYEKDMRAVWSRR